MTSLPAEPRNVQDGGFEEKWVDRRCSDAADPGEFQPTQKEFHGESLSAERQATQVTDWSEWHPDDVIITEDEPIEAWRRVWREGLAPQLSTEGLRGLAKALAEDSPRLGTGMTTSPPD